MKKPEKQSVFRFVPSPTNQRRERQKLFLKGKGKGKGKIHPRKGHEGPEGE